MLMISELTNTQTKTLKKKKIIINYNNIMI